MDRISYSFLDCVVSKKYKFLLDLFFMYHRRRILPVRILSLGEYLEPINRHTTEDKPVYRSTLDKIKSYVYSQVYNHLNLETAHVMDLDTCNENKDKNHKVFRSLMKNYSKL